MAARPAWQTDELEDEWIDQEEDDDFQAYASLHAHSCSDLSLTQPIGSLIVRSENAGTNSSDSSNASGGTFLVKEDEPALPLLPKTPGQNKKPFGKDIFTPLALEKMFEPPSPPSQPAPLPPGTTTAPAVRSRLSQVYTPGEDDTEIIMDNSGGYGELESPADESGGAPASSYHFTFEVPRGSPFNPVGSTPQAQSTPGPPCAALPNFNPPLTDPRLRLFQFQYDTFTREHLSAMVDSIAVNTPSGGSGTANTGANTSSAGLSPVREASISRLRSAKRIKLSPASELSDSGDGAVTIFRPQSLRKDYVGESKSLMEKIREARDFSTVSTVASAQSPGQAGKVGSPKDQPQPSSSTPIPNDPQSRVPSSTGTASSSKRGAYSSLAYRQQAANLMAQIRRDMKGTKRVFSEETDASHLGLCDRHNRSVTETTVGHDTFPAHSQLAHEGPSNEASTQSQFKNGKYPSAVGERAGGGIYPQEQDDTNDLTRFVSSSTTSGTTLTAGSTGSFVKHPGPKQITRITPEDVPALPDRVGKMVFDKVLMKWVKVSADAPEEDERHPPVADANDSEDPFRDFESLREEDTSRQPDVSAVVIEGEYEDHDDDVSADVEQSRIEEVEESEVEDEEEAELTSFSFDSSSAELVQVVADEGQHLNADMTMTDSEEEEEEATETTGPSFDIDSDESDNEYYQQAPGPDTEPALQDSPPHLLAPPTTTALLSTPNPSSRATADPTPTSIIRSALKSSSVTPVSAMKDPSRSSYTPAHRLGHRRSVSFSDGRRDGPILGVGRNAPTPDATELEDDDSLVAESSKASAPLVPSARSKRIAEFLDDLEDPIFDESPSKTSSSGRPPEELKLQKPRRPSTMVANGDSPNRGASRRVFSRSHSAKSPRSTERNPNATFLTECSFGVTHDRLVQVITDVEPFEPHWEDLTSVDLSKRNLDGVARLKEFLPRLDSLALNDNHLSWLSGVPGTVRSLSVVSNLHLLSLENLDISRNQIDSLRQLECLRHLRELRADGNKIDSTDGLHNLDGLVKLSLQGNRIRHLKLHDVRWTRLEMLNLSHNRLGNVEGLASLAALIALNLDNNALGELEPGKPMPRLRILRVSGNRLQQLNASPFPNLRTLYADNNSLGTITKAHRLTKLENLSLRNQNAKPGL
ncbi:hypothetical protein POSPLADRAFT_1160148 [Postia placenta MAD-698-R-SB12]|uniref:Septation initiation network scaffold protein cdc11 n=1 Tax=Postia placenta MAD-698-R-SB12 TaxID=670580 RepID=A0A1X6MJ36_9APHY|nr:hypothetical protein POSPLADRAFT_1160148 [Postia placenta MAD-698-R-SB12]OSX56457.1 hypothetical protein POSPLADRAFT_1160148 [Postia placenta MAD-698-R-SB12]